MNARIFQAKRAEDIPQYYELSLEYLQWFGSMFSQAFGLNINVKDLKDKAEAEILNYQMTWLSLAN